MKGTKGMHRVEILNIERNGLNIYGKLYVPSGAEDHPLVILSHIFGGSSENTAAYAEYFADHGFASFAYDFVGGGNKIRSDGSMTEMSVLTEAADLNTVIDHFLEHFGERSIRIFLFGASQGGFVSTYVAGSRPDDIAGLVLMYPAFVLQDDSRRRNPDPDSGPDTMRIMGMRVGRIYDQDAQSFDIYDIMKQYTGKVLIVHGTADSMAPLSYSERAVETFPDAELVTLEGADHIFCGKDMEEASRKAVRFMEDIMG